MLFSTSRTDSYCIYLGLCPFVLGQYLLRLFATKFSFGLEKAVAIPYQCQKDVYSSESNGSHKLQNGEISFHPTLAVTVTRLAIPNPLMRSMFLPRASCWSLKVCLTMRFVLPVMRFPNSFLKLVEMLSPRRVKRVSSSSKMRCTLSWLH